MATDRPNILFLMTDQQRADALGCAGGAMSTPHLDALAARGVRFAQCFTPSPVCMSARLTLATGRYPHTTGLWDNDGGYNAPPNTPTWMRAVRDAGYRTSLFGKTHLYAHHPEVDMRDQEPLLHALGLDDVDEIGGPRASTRVMSHMTVRWQELGWLEAYRADYAERYGNKPHVARPSVLPPEEYADTYVGARAVEYLSAYDRAEPWCCWVSFGGPHEPWDAPEPYHSMYAPTDMAAALPRMRDSHPRPRGALDRRFETSPALSPEDVAALRADYAGNVTLIDEQIGRILGAIEARGELENTFIIFTSDHGEMNGDHGLIYKQQMLDSAVRVPLIACGPGVEARGAVSQTVVEMHDVGATIMEAVDAAPGYKHAARALQPQFHDPAAPGRGDAFAEIAGEIMLFDGRWKTVLNQSGEVYLLFDQAEDPTEQINRAGDPACEDIRTRARLRILERLVTSQIHVGQ